MIFRKRPSPGPAAPAPIPVSSGRTDRHRLHRGGDRQANSALWHIALVRMGCHRPTRDYVARPSLSQESWAQIAANAVGHGEGMGCFAAMTTRTAA